MCQPVPVEYRFKEPLVATLLLLIKTIFDLQLSVPVENVETCVGM